MNKETIARLSHKMESKEDILTLLNQIKQDDVVEMGYDDAEFYPFTMKHINYYCNPNNSFHRFKQFKIKKKTGGFRQITAPRNHSYMLLLSYINRMLNAVYTPSNSAMGFVEGRSVVTNAEKHIGKNYILNIDLKDFFPSIEQARIWKRLQIKPFNFPVAVANIIAGICSMKDVKIEDDGSKRVSYILPQGSPASPTLTNMICDKLDRRLGGLAKRFCLTYSRYADDITFSSMHNVYQKNSDFWIELKRIIHDQHFIINEKKTRLNKLGSRQEVTGIIVSHKLNVPKKYVRDIRNILYIWDRYGYNVASSKFFPKYIADRGHVKKGNPNLMSVLDGKLMYLKMVKGNNDSVYTRLYSKFKKLVEQVNNPSLANESRTNFWDQKDENMELKNKSDLIVGVVYSSNEVDIDELNNDLDSLLNKNYG